MNFSIYPSTIEVDSFIELEFGSSFRFTEESPQGFLRRGIRVLEDGYQLEVENLDVSMRPVSFETAHIEDGFFAGASIKEIAERVNSIRYSRETTKKDIAHNTGFLKLIEFDIKRMQEKEDPSESADDTCFMEDAD